MRRLGIDSLIVLVLALFAAPVLLAQEKPAPAVGNASPAIVLPHELELEEQLQIARDERDGAINRVEQLQLEKQQLASVIERMVNDALAEVQQPRMQKAAEAREAIAKKLVTAVGCSWDRGDRWNWRDRACVKPDGAVVALPKPEDKKPGGKQ